MKLKSLIVLNLMLVFIINAGAAQKITAEKTLKAGKINAQTKLNDDKTKAEELFKKGQAYWKNLDISEAIDSYTKALQLYPNYPDALRERGKVYCLIGKNQEAINDLTAYLKIAPNSAEALNYRGLAYSAIGEELAAYEIDLKKAAQNADNALSDFDKAISLEPQNSLFYNNRAKLYIIFNYHKEAIADLEEAVSLDNKSAIAYSNLGLAKFYSQTGTGFTELNRALELNPNFAEAYYNRGNLYRLEFNLDKAIADYTTAIKQNSNPKYYNARGMAHYTNGNGIAAVKDFTSAINQKNDYARAYLNRAITYKKYPVSAAGENAGVAETIVAQIGKIKSDLDAAIKYNSNLAEAYVERGNSALPSIGIPIGGGYSEEALAKIRAILADFDKAIQLDPQLAEAYNGRASCYNDLGKQDLALADYNKAIQLNPRLATAYMGRMGIYCKMGKTELSIADEKKVKELGFATINMCSFKN